jgi:hypothetical protein
MSLFLVTPRKALQNLFVSHSNSTTTQLRALLDLAQQENNLICIWTEEQDDNDDDNNSHALTDDSLEFVLPIQEFLRKR